MCQALCRVLEGIQEEAGLVTENPLNRIIEARAKTREGKKYSRISEPV